MKRLLPIFLASLVLSTASFAAGRSQPSFKPATLPTAQDAEAAIGTLATPQAPMSQFVPPSPAMTPQKMIDGLSAIKGSRDGTQTEVDAPRRVQRMLMRKQSGMIGGDGTDKKDDKKKKKKKTSDLTPISDTAQFPYTTMGVIASGCTGTVVMKRFVLTAAWCVYDLKAKSFYKNLNFFPAINGKKTPYGEVAWKNAWVAKGFTDSGDLNFGYGLIELDKDIGDSIGWFGFGDVPKFNFKRLDVTGYPFATVPPLTMWSTKCAIDAAEENAIFYRCPGDAKALSTMLGAPMWYKGKEDNEWQILGIHVTSQNDKQDSFWAARLNRAHTETIIAWAKSADNKDTGTEETDTEDTGTDDQNADDESDDEATDEDTGNGDDQVVDKKPDCTCDDQAQPQ